MMTTAATTAIGNGFSTATETSRRAAADGRGRWMSWYASI
jgi:hypothetical protein